jgi:FO synthase
MAGSVNGSYKTISQFAALTAPLGRPIRQRTTLYENPSAERLAVAGQSDGVCTSVRGNQLHVVPR